MERETSTSLVGKTDIELLCESLNKKWNENRRRSSIYVVDIDFAIVASLIYVAVHNALRLEKQPSDNETVCYSVDMSASEQMTGKQCLCYSKFDGKHYDVAANNLSKLEQIGLPVWCTDVLKQLLADNFDIESFVDECSKKFGESEFMVADSDLFLPLSAMQIVGELCTAKEKSVLNVGCGCLSMQRVLSGYSSYCYVLRHSMENSRDFLDMVFDVMGANVEAVEPAEASDRSYDLVFAFCNTAPSDPSEVSDGAFNALEQFETITSDGGAMVVFFTPGRLSYNREKKLRKLLTESNRLDSVVFFKNDTFFNVAIVLRKGRIDGENVRMVCGDGEQLEVSMKEVLDNDCNWDPYLYRHNRDIVEKDGFDVVRLCDLAEKILKQPVGDCTEGRLLTREIVRDWTDCKLNVDDIPIVDMSDEIQRGKGRLFMATEPMLFVSASGKFVYCEATIDKVVYCSHSWKPLKVKKGVYYGYLAMKAKEAIRYLSGGKLSYLSLIKDYKVHIPSLSASDTLKRQQELFDKAAEKALLQRIEKAGVKKYIERIREDYKTRSSRLRHDIRPCLGEIDSARKLIEIYLKKQQYDKVAEKLESQLRNIEKIRAFLEHSTDEQELGTSAACERVDLNDYLAANCRCYNNVTDSGVRYAISYTANVQQQEYDEDEEVAMECFVIVARYDLDKLFNNIVENAKRHGFTDSERDDYRIDVVLSVDYERKMYQIDFANNGNPLPEGLDKARYGVYGEMAGKTGNTGIGGNSVKIITDHYFGDYDIFTAPDGRVVTRVLLPMAE